MTEKLTILKRLEFEDIMGELGMMVEREYVCLRAMGLTEGEAELAIGERHSEVKTVRFKPDEKVQELEGIAVRGGYREDAILYYGGILKGKALFVLDGILSRGFKWRELQKGEQVQILSAVKMVLGGGGRSEISQGSYESLVHTVRKEI